MRSDCFTFVLLLFSTVTSVELVLSQNYKEFVVVIVCVLSGPNSCVNVPGRSVVPLENRISFSTGMQMQDAGTRRVLTF